MTKIKRIGQHLCIIPSIRRKDNNADLPIIAGGTNNGIPSEAYNDETFAKLINEAEKYLGYPYVFGGSSPATSFDCSGFVYWVYTHEVGYIIYPAQPHKVYIISVKEYLTVTQNRDLISLRAHITQVKRSRISVYMEITECCTV